MASPFGQFNIDAFKANFKNAARNYLFYVKLDIPSASTSQSDQIFLVRSSVVPSKSIEKKDLGWQGYKLPFGGTTTHEDWTCTFLMDPSASLYKDMIKWSNMVHDPKTNVHGMPADYMKTVDIQLIHPDGKSSILDVKLIGAWPVSVAQIDLNYDNTDVVTFQCTFAYVRHEVS